MKKYFSKNGHVANNTACVIQCRDNIKASTNKAASIIAATAMGNQN